jgi:hypothetical protein
MLVEGLRTRFAGLNPFTYLLNENFLNWMDLLNSLRIPSLWLNNFSGDEINARLRKHRHRRLL